MSADCEVAVVGGGLVGASLAIALSQSGRSVALIEAAAPRPGEARWDERCIAVNAASRNIFTALGVWDALSACAAPILSTHISERGRFGVARFTAEEAGLPALGHNIPVRALGEILGSALRRTSAVLYCPDLPATLESTDDAVQLRLDAGAALRARLVVAADGAQSAVRKLLGIAAQSRDYGQQAIVTAVRTARPHRGCAYERFTPDGPIALLPKAEDACSLVWTLPSAMAQERLAWDEARFMQAAQDAFGERLGAFNALGGREAHTLSQVLNTRLTAPRLIFAGNAAQSLHPVAAQGFNLGLRDIATIAELVAEAADPGAPPLLQEYERRRAADRASTAGFTDHLVRLFSNRVPGLAHLRHLGLLALDLVPPFKQRMLWHNLGYRGETPRSARL